MKKNKIIFGALTLLSITCILMGFSFYNFNKHTKLSDNSLKQETISNEQTDKQEETKEQEQDKLKQNEDINKQKENNKENIDKKDENNKINTEQKNDQKVSQESNKNIQDNLNYVSSKLGLVIIFPESWNDKYTVEENEDGIVVFYKSKYNTEKGQGILFEIVNKTPDAENFIDTIGTKRYIKTNKGEYIIGGTTDIGYSDAKPDYNDYKKMKNECPEILKNLKVIINNL